MSGRICGNTAEYAVNQLMNRKRWPKEVKAKILIKCRRICAFCFFLDFKRGVVARGQIAHIDRDSSNSTEENGAYLCKHHHDEYDIESKQSVRFMPDELREAQAQVFKYIKEGGLASARNADRIVRNPQVGYEITGSKVQGTEKAARSVARRL